MFILDRGDSWAEGLIARYQGDNGDDCVSVINGARDVVAQNGFCGFSSHGLSIGSLGRNGAEHTVQDILFKNWTMEGAVYGARVCIARSKFLARSPHLKRPNLVQELDWGSRTRSEHYLGGYHFGQCFHWNLCYAKVGYFS